MEAIDSARMTDKIITGAAYATSTVTTIWGFSFNQWIGLAGLGLTVVIAILNFYHKRVMRNIAREQLEIARMRVQEDD